MSVIQITKYIGKGFFVLLKIYTVIFMIIFFVLAPHKVPAYPEYGKGGYVDNCMSIHNIDSCGGLDSVVYMFIFGFTYLLFDIFFFYPWESLIVLTTVSGLVGFYLSNEKKAHERNS